jgi:hypothetical protein
MDDTEVRRLCGGLEAVQRLEGSLEAWRCFGGGEVVWRFTGTFGRSSERPALEWRHCQ